MGTIYIPQYSLKHAAHMIHVSPKTIRRWTQSGKMQGYQVGDRGAWYYSLDSINKRRELYALPSLTVEQSKELFNSY